MNDDKILHVPYVNGLDNYSLEEIAGILEEKGAREMIQSVNWSNEFPYQPLTVFSIAHSGKYIHRFFCEMQLPQSCKLRE